MNPQESIRQVILRHLLLDLKEQFECKTYDVNGCVRSVAESILVDQVHHATKTGQDVTSDALRQELTMIAFCLAKAPCYWVQLLSKDEIESESAVIYINFPLTLTKVYRLIELNIDELMAPSAPGFSFEELYMDNKNMQLLASLLNSIAQEIASSYEQGKEIVQKEIKSIEKNIDKYKIMNSFLLFGILKQTSRKAQLDAQEILSVYLFRNVPVEDTENFCKYIVENYDSITLKCRISANPEIWSQQKLEEHHQEQTILWINYLKNSGADLKLSKVVSTNGEIGIMVEHPEGSENPENNLILKVNKKGAITATNCKISQKPWKVEKPNMKQLKGVYDIIKSLDPKSAAKDLNKELTAFGMRSGTYVSMGNTLGQCLANINDYKDANGFLADLSKKAVVTGSMNYILSEIPIMNYLFIAGGLSFTFYHTFKNEATSNKAKMKQIGSASVTAVGSIGSAIAGMSLGQLLIPVPFVGAFIGGVVGGFLGEKGSKQITTILDKQSFKSLITYLHNNMEGDKCWEYKDRTLSKLGINKSYFDRSNPRKIEHDKIWMTAICFSIVSFYESKRFVKHTQAQLEEVENMKKKQKKQKSSKSQEKVIEEKVIKEKEEQEKDFKNEFNLVAIIEYLTEHGLNIMDSLDKVEALIDHILAEI